MPALVQVVARKRAEGAVRGAIPGAVDVSGLVRAAGAIANDHQNLQDFIDREQAEGPGG